VPLLAPHQAVPVGFSGPRFRARLITIADLVKDYEAVMASAERLRERFPLWNWPPEHGLTLEQDLIDLG
jgi:hypothetical protein